MKLKILDFTAVFFSVCVIIAFSILVYGDKNGEPEVFIQSREGTFIYPLKEDRIINVSGPIGTTVISIKDGGVRVVSSPCTDKICINAGILDKKGSWTACLPNKVLVRVRSKSEKAVDAVSF